MQRPTDRLGSRLAGIVVGATIGLVVGLIVAVNLVIYLGPDQGYESNIAEVFEHSTVLGLAVVAVVVAGPIFGIAMARRMQHQRGPAAPPARSDRP